MDKKDGIHGTNLLDVKNEGTKSRPSTSTGFEDSKATATEFEGLKFYGIGQADAMVSKQKSKAGEVVMEEPVLGEDPKDAKQETEVNDVGENMDKSDGIYGNKLFDAKNVDTDSSTWSTSCGLEDTSKVFAIDFSGQKLFSIFRQLLGSLKVNK
ncbi:OLC1v1004795C2 [Oldenlandia corymbosa var. corymbosa]|uniref:OLC1v1004795C2 n=1 Tax=Oldenlandia corymbosa var. corymbosa TaxID=529605 RepID=A0AAV1DG30_OLDCO|nr:OLC1v1004795C2 [Oldenlandia corymbosa var. corymbosa]